VGKNKGATRTRKLERKNTFITEKDLKIKSSGPVRSLNVVKRAALNKNAPPMRAALVGGKPTVFFKAHDAEHAASQNAVASTRMARFLGMEKVIAHNAFANVKDTIGAVSGAVPGVPLYSEEKNKEVKFPWEAGLKKADIPDWLRAGQREERNGKYYEVSKKKYQWVDFSDPKIQKGMSDLQLFDAITGQVDRHAGNIYVDPTTGEVSGIDDDKSFGQGMAADDLAKTDIPGRFYRGLPPLVDEATAERLLDPELVDPTKLPEILARRDVDTLPLTDKQIAEAVRRFDRVKQYLRDLQKAGALVGQNGTSWGDETYQQALANPSHSYLGFQADMLEQVRQAAVNDPELEIVGAPRAPAPPPVPVGLNLAQILQGQQAPPQNVPPVTINQPQPTVVLPPAQGGPVTPPAQNVVQAAQSRLDATRPRLWIGAVPKRRGASDLDAADADTTSSEEADNSTSE
jgi:hypothetical protein